MFTLASLRSDGWTTCPELVDDFIGIRILIPDQDAFHLWQRLQGTQVTQAMGVYGT